MFEEISWVQSSAAWYFTSKNLHEHIASTADLPIGANGIAVRLW